MPAAHPVHWFSKFINPLLPFLTWPFIVGTYIWRSHQDSGDGRQCRSQTNKGQNWQTDAAEFEEIDRDTAPTAGQRPTDREYCRAELRQLVEGQVEDLGHEPQHMQIVPTEVEHVVQVCLRNTDGTFQIVEPLLDATEPQDETTGEDEETADTATLREALWAAEEAEAALQVKVNYLRQQLTQERDKYKQLWVLNCLQMAEFN